ncbi:MAG: cell envelope integrity protein CreD [Bacteroidetes bacterium]|nr:cell envelope integrity protein CreD [Bacteroidota bacterium]
METESIINRFNAWLKRSVLVKIGTIGFLVLILLIPSSMIESVIYERQSRAEEAIDEISSKWGEAQLVTGPIVQLPYSKLVKTKTGVETLREFAYFLPARFKVNGNLKAEELNRGIFDAVVFNGTFNLSFGYTAAELTKIEIEPSAIDWSGAKLLFGFSDLRGLSSVPSLTFQNKQLAFEAFHPLVSEELPAAQYLAAAIPNLNSLEQLANVSMKLSLRGSKFLSFVPVGNESEIVLKSNWPDPGFDGKFLPVQRQVSDSGFTASWSVLGFNRPFAQQWLGKCPPDLGNSLATVNLLMPVDQYQKSMRSSKYGMLVVLLSFLALFLTEMILKIRIHPFQYLLIGAAMVLFYILLLSFSEQIGFSYAYLLSTALVVLLISAYSLSIFGKWKNSLGLLAVLSAFYGYVFVLIQQQQFALLLGSLGLFLVLALLMYVSRKINWYQD